MNIFGGFVYLVRGLFAIEGENVAYLPFSYSIISSVGALLVLCKCSYLDEI